ncbi:hypothetical protein [Thalassotalea euphylliae]|uniref:Uncharacterized protein n=1 Tax=Thalassotalea euphylliae TaxID=1655234 RepID=A0A3E0U3T4_9GAMM|nr:hypothetical protein [Thalassotalea euphylliae]REL30855.1 hypothetical protein DXX94_09050 [Thalassotalea euphylliae]
MKISDIDGVLSDFIVTKIREVTPIWENDSLLAKYFSNSGFYLDKFDLCYLTSYAIKETNHFKNIAFNESDTEVFKSEKYGGVGVGKNLGGARCGNIGQFQIKGIGRNNLADKDAPSHHSNGTLSLLDATIETIYTNTLNALLPNGVVGVLGLVATGERNAYCEFSGTKPEFLTWGALLTREQSVRPAHFIRNSAITKENLDILQVDKHRTNEANRSLLSYFKDLDHIRAFLLNSFSKQIQQFAFARVAGIAHGAISASNLTLDGRWIDLNTADFVNSNQNNSISENAIPFYSEPHSIVDIYIELTHTLNKINKINLNTNEFISAYQYEFNLYFDSYSLWILGLPIQPNIEEKNNTIIGRYFAKHLYRNTRIIHSNTKLSALNNLKTEIIHCLIKEITSKTKSKNDELRAFVNAYKSVLSSKSEKFKARFSIEKRAYLILTLLLALKRTCFQFFFARARLTKIILKNTQTCNISAIPELIETVKEVSNWAFYNSNTKSILFSSKEIQINFDAIAQEFSISNKYDHSTQSFSCIIELIDYINSISDNSLYIAEYDFKPDLLIILTTICQLKTTLDYEL